MAPISLAQAVEPVPPKIKMGGHHWLEQRNINGHVFGLVVPQ